MPKLKNTTVLLTAILLAATASADLQFKDADGDGWYTDTTVQCGDPGPDWTMNQPSGGSGDCAPNDASVNPGESEVCNNEDTNCDGIIDNDRAGVKNTACMKVDTISNSNPSSGSGWIEGNKLHWADGSIEYQGYNEGNTVSTGLTGVLGYSWVEGDYIHWIDQSGDERRFYGVDTGTDILGSEGQGWVENSHLHYVDQNGNERAVK